MTTSRLRFLSFATFLATSIAIGSSEKTALAEEVSPDAKGITGGVMLGAEIVTIPMAIAGVKSGWAYGIGGAVGAIGGGIGGFFIEDASTDGRVPTYMMAGGLALLIPATILVLNATRYQPASNASEDRAPTNQPAADPGERGKSIVTPSAGGTVGGSVETAPATPAPAAPATTPAPSGGQTPPLSLIDFRGPSLRLGLPVPEVRQMYSLAERRSMGLPQATELRLPIVRGTF